MKKRGKWRRGEDQLTERDRRVVSEMLRDGYDVSAIMERFGLTDEEQVLVAYRQPVSSSPLDKVSASVGFFRTSGADLYRAVKAQSGGRSWSMLDNSEYF